MTEKLLKELVRDTPYLSLKVPLCYTKVLRKTIEQPMIIRQAEGLKNTLENLPILIRPDEIIVGTFDENIPVAIPRLEASGFRIMKELETLPYRSVNPINVKDEDIKTLREEIAPFYENFKIDAFARKLAPKSVFETQFSGCAYIATEIGGIAHAVIDYPRLLSKGLKKYIKLSNERLEYFRSSNSQEANKIAFFKSMKIILESLINFSNKYADKAETMAKTEANSNRKAELNKIAKTCRNIPENPPKDLHEAIQFLWFIHMALHLENFEHGISFGRIDQYLLPFYDKESEKTLRLFKNLFLKTNEIIALYDTVATQYFGGMATTQNILIGGINIDGKDASNALSYIILKATDEISLPSPNLVVRIHNGTPDEIYKNIAKILAKGKNVIGLYNDKTAIKCLLKHNIPLEEARNYGIVGCVGLSTSGLSFDNTGAIFLNLPKALELSLGTDTSLISNYVEQNMDPKSFKSMDDVLVEFKIKLRAILEMAVLAANAYQQAHLELKPTPLMSLCIRGCFEEGIDVNRGSAKYNFTGLHATGFSDLVDSLAALDFAVFKEKKTTMDQLIHVLKKNFRGNNDLRNYLLMKCPKYGVDDDQVDIYAEKVGRILAEAIDGLKCVRGGEYRVGVHAMTTHVGFGIFTGALPSGRKKGEPLTKDVAPSSTGEKALTSVINSITKLDHSLLTNGLACTLNITPEIARMEDGNILKALIQSYFEQGGLHLQFNAISLDNLIDAQKNPERYGDLMIRVSGYSARFIDLAKSVQNEIIQAYLYKNLEIKT